MAGGAADTLLDLFWKEGCSITSNDTLTLLTELLRLAAAPRYLLLAAYCGSLDYTRWIYNPSRLIGCWSVCRYIAWSLGVLYCRR